MINYKADLTEINTAYCMSLSYTELSDKLATLDGLLSERGLNDTNRANGEALRMRLTCKTLLTGYLISFDSAEAEKICAFTEKNIPSARRKGYTNSLSVMEKSAALARHLAEIFSGADGSAPSAEMCALSVDTAKEYIDVLTTAENDMKNDGSAVSPFGEKVRFTDVRAAVCAELEKRLEKAINAYAAALERVIPFTVLDGSKGKYYPLPDYDEGGKANALVLCTPFADEARLYAAHCQPTVYEFDASGLCKAADIENAFALASHKRAAALFIGIDGLNEELKNSFLIAALNEGRSGNSIFLLDTGGGELYAEAVCVAGAADGLSALDVSVTYITMPVFAEVVGELTELGRITDVSQRAALAEMPFLGFAGLNEIAEPRHFSDWQTHGKRISDSKSAAAKHYIAGLRSPMMFIDPGWGDFSSGMIDDGSVGEFDYDGVHGVDWINVRRIAESGADVFSVCGMLVRYCTVGTGDYTEWRRLPREELTRRVELATKLVFKALRIGVEPQVEVLDELRNMTAGAQCCDGGKRILYKYDCCTEITWIRDAIVHESFHALQSKLTGGNYSEWYYYNMGITYGRVCEWINTMKTRYDHNTRSSVYKVHMYEADARAFEVDCRRGADAYWNRIDLE